MKRHHFQSVCTFGIFATGAGAAGGLCMWAVAATEFMEPVAFYENAVLGLTGVSAVGALTLGTAVTVQYRAVIRARQGS
ncbi:hypothetical protein [Streptomyces sp. NPDC127103]|uniref:hypothetical protein n=1 Tax=Streptomyces sp. NPDC127103 TaxID=3347139 RepID=UPI003649FBEE